MIMMTRAILLASAPPPAETLALALALTPTWTRDLARVGVGEVSPPGRVWPVSCWRSNEERRGEREAREREKDDIGQRSVKQWIKGAGFVEVSCLLGLMQPAELVQMAWLLGKWGKHSLLMTCPCGLNTVKHKSKSLEKHFHTGIKCVSGQTVYSRECN